MANGPVHNLYEKNRSSVNRPWGIRAKELETLQGPWCDYAAWEEWISSQESKLVDGGDILGEMDYRDKINLYVIFCNIFD